MAANSAHLTPEQVARILQIVEDTDAIVIGGQSVNLWAEHYRGRDPVLEAQGPFTSKDIDFFSRSSNAATMLVDALDDGHLYVPSLDDQTPSSMVVIGSLEGRKIEIDFMGHVLGLKDQDIFDRYVALMATNPQNSAEIRVLLLHPLDCLKSRLANIDTLGRTDSLSLNQTRAAIRVVEMYVRELLEDGRSLAMSDAQETLRQLFFVGRDRSRILKDHSLDLTSVMLAFLEEPRFDSRWRDKTLKPAIDRLFRKLGQKTGASPEIAPAF